jgi:hypothetical protein
MTKSNHANGLAIEWDDANWASRNTESGFSFSLKDAGNRRTPPALSVDWSPAPKPQGDFPAARQNGSRKAFARTDKSEGGSGGDQYTLTIWTPCTTKGHILVKASDQSEASAPDFGYAWDLLWSARCPD